MTLQNALPLDLDEGNDRHPPMLKQYLEYKASFPDCMLFFQVGDFYELFFEDAVAVARALNLTLTSRDKNSPTPVPMCGVPVAVVDGYISRLVEKGFSAAVVSQAAPLNGVVHRSLERVVTPGVRVLAGAEDSAERAVLACVAISSAYEAAIACVEVEQGAVLVREGLRIDDVPRELARLQPNEVVLPLHDGTRAVDRRRGWVQQIERMNPGVAVKFRDSGVDAVDELTTLPGYNGLGAAGRRVVRNLAAYVRETTVKGALRFRSVNIDSDASTLAIDATSRANLELVRNLRDGSLRGTLFEYLDATVTRTGKRCLYAWLLTPLGVRSAIEARHHAVRALLSAPLLHKALRSHLSHIPDLDRIATRCSLGVVTPLELAALRDGLRCAELIRVDLRRELPTGVAGSFIGSVGEELVVPDECRTLLDGALEDAAPLSSRLGGIFRPGFHAELDELRTVRSTALSMLAALEGSERVRTGIASLKVRYNGVLGYFYEITKANLGKIPPDYVRRQSTAQADRFVNEGLSGLAEKILGAEERQFRLEQELFIALRERLAPFLPTFHRVSSALGRLDCVQSFAQRALEEGLVEPTMSEDVELEIEEGRHPVLARSMRHDFVANSLSMPLEGVRFWVLTGPNMGGKSTFLRQNALIVVLSQIGSYVPAKSARIGIVDRIFARLGASDNLGEGESTFMVEMREAAQIVAIATERSLLLIDEIGRGTATSDGVAIARSIVEWLALRVKSRALFATHFYELTEMEESCTGIGNLSVGSVETKAGVVFTHEIQRGPASRSYGLEVARLAGLPEPLLQRARELQDVTPLVPSTPRQLPIFSISAPPTQPHRVVQMLRSVDIVNTTPLEGLMLLKRLQDEVLSEDCSRLGKTEK